VVLAVQSDRGLGDDQEADRLVGAAGSFVLFAVAEPERIIRLAGTRRLAEETSTSWGDHGATTTTSMVWKDQVDANVVRALAPGQAYVLSGGRAQLCQVIRPPGGDGPRPSGAAAWKPAPGDGPARAVGEREYPALPGRVNPAPSAPLRASGVDPSARAGSSETDASGGRGHPHGDREGVRRSSSSDDLGPPVVPISGRRSPGGPVPRSAPASGSALPAASGG
jgi:hypothetical protein